MVDKKYVSYLRVSTGKQGVSGLGLEAQRETVRLFLDGSASRLIGELIEVESGRKAERPQLAKALSQCRVMGAVLIVANVSRLTRNPDFMSTIVSSGAEVRFCDLPNVEGPAGRFMLRQMLAVAELEAGMIADRTRKALAAAKARGVQLGTPENLSNQEEGRKLGRERRSAIANSRANDLAPIIASIRASGANTLRQISDQLNQRGIPTARGGCWTAVQVSRTVRRIATRCNGALVP